MCGLWTAATVFFIREAPVPKTILRRHNSEGPVPPQDAHAHAEAAAVPKRRFRPQSPHQAVMVAAPGKGFFVVYGPISADVAGPFSRLDDAIAAIMKREVQHGVRVWGVRYGKEHPKGSTPERMELHQAVERIASRLGETKKAPVQTIRDIIMRFGIQFADELCAEAVKVHASTGLPIKNPAAYSGRTRRTLGGVFFYLSKQRVPLEEYKGVRSWARGYERWKENCRGHDEWLQRRVHPGGVPAPG